MLNEWPHEDTIQFAIGLATQEDDPLPGAATLLRVIGERCGEPMLGGHRAVFSVGDDWVLKVPLTWEGDAMNQYEACHSDPKIPLAQCRLHISEPSGVALLWMERITPLHPGKRYDLPEWTDFVDCAQVGYTTSGELVAYDL
jgi:hypothetical protein